MIAEGLYRSAIDILGGSSPSQLESGREDYVDILALTRARCGQVLGWAKGREAEAERLSVMAMEGWQGPPSLSQVLDFDLASRVSNLVDPTQEMKGTTQPAGSFPVVDVRFGRVLV
eukprot:TRINITY_DN3591_c0_g3_i1.p1 TRINITY_DN3591_c0_g3~~TRINITY_DN3591_c0_g3_i1.p1  ORF type:complete len:116 (+),score=19.25 TRINITY_DN3591_c0_g3_i1:3-350(+)